MSKIPRGKDQKQVILDKALDLFVSKGYDNISVEMILDVAQVNKETFNRYFKSKYAVLEAITLQQANILVRITKTVAYDKKLNAIEKINKLIISALDLKKNKIESRIKIFSILNADQNVQLRDKLLSQVIMLATPVIMSIFEQGIKENLFNNNFPEEAGEFYIILINRLNFELAMLIMDRCDKKEKLGIIEHKLLFYENMLERLLGAKKGVFILKDAVINDINTYLDSIDT